MPVRFLLFLSLILMGCPENEVLPIDKPDATLDVIDAAEMDSGTEDIQEEDVEADLGPQDSDGDGLLDSNDNCPMIANPEQIDRDRDNVGDVCDNYPFISDSANPDNFDLLLEDEATKSNNNQNEADASYGNLSLPLFVTSKVDAAADLDWYNFEISEPTALILHMKTNETTWPAAIVVGRDFRNANVYRVAISPEIGTDIDREMFIAMPGKYAIVASDTRNLIASAADVGGDGFEYTFSLSKIPLPPSEAAALNGGPNPKTYDKTLNVYEISTEGRTAVFATGVGATVEQNSFHNPAITILDGNDPSKVIANTGLAEVDEGKVSTIFQLSTDKILLIEDFVDRFGSATSTIAFQSTTLENEPETTNTASDERSDLIPWIGIDSQITGTLTPRNGQADEDYFLLSVRRGEAIEIILTPDEGSLLSTRLDLGHWVANQGDSFLISAHRSDAVEGGDPTILKYFFDGSEDGEVAVRIMNTDSTENVAHGYKLEVKKWDPMPTMLNGLPQEITIDLASGDLGIVEIDLVADTIVSSFSEDIEIYSESRWTDLMSWEKLSEANRDVSFRVPRDGTYRLDVRDFLGRSGSSKVTIVSNTAKNIATLPAEEANDLFTSAKQFFTVQLEEGDLFDVRVNAQNFYPQIEILDDAFTRQGFGYVSEIFQAQRTGEYTVAISASDGRAAPDRTFTLGVQKPNPTLLNLDTAVNSVADVKASAHWYKINVVADKDYEIRFNAENFQALAEVLDPSNLKTIARSSNGVMRWHSDIATELWVSIAETNNNADATFDYNILFSELVTNVITDGNSVLGSISPDAFAYYDFAAPPGLIKVSVSPIGDWRPSITLLDGDTNQREFDARQVGNRLVFGQSATRNYRLAVGRQEHQQQTLLDFTIQYDFVDVANTTAEIEPNDSVAEAQLLSHASGVTGATAGTEMDWYAFSVNAQQRFWVFVTDNNNGGLNRFDAELRVTDPNGLLVQNNRFSGEGYLPAIHGALPTLTGTHNITFGPANGATLDGGYAIYYLAEDIASAVEVEPNDTLVDAQIIAPFYETLQFDTNVANGDIDVVAIRIPVSSTDVSVFLEGAADGFDLRLLDGGGTQLAASGPSHDGNMQPKVEHTIPTSGLYYVELSGGSGPAKIVFSKTP